MDDPNPNNQDQNQDKGGEPPSDPSDPGPPPPNPGPPITSLDEFMDWVSQVWAKVPQDLQMRLTAVFADIRTGLGLLVRDVNEEANPGSQGGNEQFQPTETFLGDVRTFWRGLSREKRQHLIRFFTEAEAGLVKLLAEMENEDDDDPDDGVFQGEMGAPGSDQVQPPNSFLEWVQVHWRKIPLEVRTRMNVKLRQDLATLNTQGHPPMLQHEDLSESHPSSQASSSSNEDSSDKHEDSSDKNEDKDQNFSEWATTIWNRMPEPMKRVFLRLFPECPIGFRGMISMLDNIDHPEQFIQIVPAQEENPENPENPSDPQPASNADLGELGPMLMRMGIIIAFINGMQYVMVRLATILDEEFPGLARNPNQGPPPQDKQDP